LTLTRQQVNSLAGNQIIPVPSLPANRHRCHQDFYLTNPGRVLQFQIHRWTGLRNRG
jgi:hypothetical protein